MPVIKVSKPFKHSEDGNSVIEYEIGEHEVSARCAEVAVGNLEVAELLEEKTPSDKEPAKSASKSKKPANEKATESE